MWKYCHIETLDWQGCYNEACPAKGAKLMNIIPEGLSLAKNKLSIRKAPKRAGQEKEEGRKRTAEGKPSIIAGQY
jgi:hypothetical protein